MRAIHLRSARGTNASAATLSGGLGGPVHYFADTAVLAATLAGQALVGNFRNHQALVYGDDILSVGHRSLSKEVTSSNDHEADKIIIDLI